MDDPTVTAANVTGPATAPAAPAAQPYAIFISFRFSESVTEAKALQDALQARGHRTFVSDEMPGSDLQEAIATAISQSEVQVLLATRTYGKKTNQQYSTYQEMNWALEHNPFLVKMTEDPYDGKWEEAAAAMALSGCMWEPWAPGAPTGRPPGPSRSYRRSRRAA